jgi:RAD51-like protein 2
MNIDHIEDFYFLATLDLKNTVIDKLAKASFNTQEDFKGMTITQLAKEASLSYKEALEVMNKIKEKTGGTQSISAQPSIILSQSTQKAPPVLSNTKMTSGLELFEQQKQHLITMCREVDVELLNGGIPCGSVTEICGVPGVGKTQLGMQLAVNVQQPQEMNGCAGRAIYIDTEGSFIVERVEQIAQHFLEHLKTVSHDDKVQSAAVAAMSVDQILSNIHYYRVYNYIEQCALINILPEYMKQQDPPVKLIVLDSVTFHFRYGFDAQDNNMLKRTKLLSNMGQQLSKIAQDFSCAVVVMNQVTTKVEAETSYLAPALGQTWSHQCTNKIYLEFDNQRQQQLRVSKIKDGKTGKRYYRITNAGFRSASRRSIDQVDDEEQNRHCDDIGEGGVDQVNEFNKRARNSM